VKNYNLDYFVVLPCTVVFSRSGICISEMKNVLLSTETNNNKINQTKTYISKF